MLKEDDYSHSTLGEAETKKTKASKVSKNQMHERREITSLRCQPGDDLPVEISLSNMTMVLNRCCVTVCYLVPFVREDSHP